jgi:hypothetical protein
MDVKDNERIALVKNNKTYKDSKSLNNAATKIALKYAKAKVK